MIRFIVTSISRTVGVILMLCIIAGAYGDLQSPDCSLRDDILYKIMIALSVLVILALNGV